METPHRLGVASLQELRDPALINRYQPLSLLLKRRFSRDDFVDVRDNFDFISMKSVPDEGEVPLKYLLLPPTSTSPILQNPPLRKRDVVLKFLTRFTRRTKPPTKNEQLPFGSSLAMSNPLLSAEKLSLITLTSSPFLDSLYPSRLKSSIKFKQDTVEDIQKTRDSFNIWGRQPSANQPERNNSVWSLEVITSRSRRRNNRRYQDFPSLSPSNGDVARPSINLVTNGATEPVVVHTSVEMQPNINHLPQESDFVSPTHIQSRSNPPTTSPRRGGSGSGFSQFEYIDVISAPSPLENQSSKEVQDEDSDSDSYYSFQKSPLMLLRPSRTDSVVGQLRSTLHRQRTTQT